jgi:hypothetical protein
MFSKAVERPGKSVEAVKFDFDYGLDVDIDILIANFQEIRKSNCIQFYTDNNKIGNMLNSQNIGLFRKITGGYENQIDISKSRRRNRKITVTGDNSYEIYLMLKELLG